MANNNIVQLEDIQEISERNNAEDNKNKRRSIFENLTNQANLQRRKLKANALYGKIRMTLTPQGNWTAKTKKKSGKLANAAKRAFNDLVNSKFIQLTVNYTRIFMNKLPDHYTYSTLFLLILGVLTAFVGVAMDLLMIEIESLHKAMLPAFETSSYFASFTIQYFLWVAFSIIFLVMSVYITRVISPTAIGSGIPEVKVILSGIYLSEYLSLKTLIAKVLGLGFAVGSGVFLGKEGPLVHNAAIIGNQLSKLTIFERIRNNPTLMQQMLACSTAAGIGANLGAPIGGVLFSIEVTSTYYPLRNYWYAFLASITGAITWRILFNARFNQPWLTSIVQTNFTKLEFSIAELIFFCVLGVMCALLGVIFIKLSAITKRKWNEISSDTWVSSPYFYAVIISLFTSTLTFPKLLGKFVSLEPSVAMRDLFNESSLISLNDWYDGTGDLYLNLLLFFMIRYIMTSLSINLPVPAGLLIPLLSAGASFGRLYGEIIKSAIGNHPEYIIIPAGYAVVGSASLVGGVTHALSTAVIIFEITGDVHYLLPVLISIIISVGISKQITSLSVYDSSAKERGLPYLPDLEQSLLDVMAKDIMTDKLPIITQDMNIDNINDALDNYKEYKEYPVIDTTESGILIGMIDRESLEDIRDSYTNKDSDNLSTTTTTAAATTITIDESEIQSPIIQISEITSISNIHSIFITMRLFHVYVTRNGKLIGVVSRSSIKSIVEKKNSSSTLLKS